MARCNWRSWDEARSSAESTPGLPLLLLIRAAWCRHCDHLEDRVLAEPELVEFLDRHFVTVRIDKDESPELAERFGSGCWPSLAVLGPEGQPWVRVGNLEDSELVAVIRGAASAPPASAQPGPEPATQPATPSPPRDGLHPGIVLEVAQILRESFDAKEGGFGTGQKFPHPEVLDFAILHHAKSQDPAYAQVVQKTLDAMVEHGLFDPVSGGFFRFCRTRDWRQPDTEMRLETQAGLLRNYLEAAQLFDRADYRAVAEKTVSCIEHCLRDPETGTWWGSRDADDAYYSLDSTQRADRKPPAVEARAYTSSVAMTVSSMFKAARVLGDELLIERAQGGLHHLLEQCYVPGKGMHHFWDGRPQLLGLLADQVLTARAVLHAMQYTGDHSLLPIAEDLARSIASKESARHGGFFDVPEDDPRFDQARGRNTAILENGLAAEVLLRLHALTGDEEAQARARRALQSFAAEFKSYGYHSAAYGRAVELLFHPPLEITVVGTAGDPQREALLGVAQRTYVPSKMVRAIDPEQEAESLERMRLPVREEARAYIALKFAHAAETSDPEQLERDMLAAEKRRGAAPPRSDGS